MKHLIQMILFGLTLCAAALAQNTKVPEVVMQSFEKKIPEASDVEWVYDSQDSMWEVTYEIGIDEFTSMFTLHGKWVETEKEIAVAELPDAVREALQTRFAGYDIEEAEWVETPDGIFYEVEVERGKGDTEVVYELLFSPEGKLLKQESDHEEYEKPH